MGRWQSRASETDGGAPLHRLAAPSGPPPHEPRSQGGMIHESLAWLAYSGAMLNLIPQPEFEPRPQAYAEAVSRLATIRHALRLVDGGFSAGPVGDEAIAGAWDQAGEARQRWFDKRSERLVGATAA